MKTARKPQPDAGCCRPRRPRRGAALLVCLFVAAMVSLIVVTILQTQTLRYSALRNTGNYDRAVYLAAAGVHHALSELEQDFSWRVGIPETEFPAGSGCTYSAAVQDGADDTVIVEGSGTAGGVTRRLEATIQQGG